MTSSYHPEGPVARKTEGLYCEVDAEPLDRYRQGGYHPTHLGDTFKTGRYQIIHKLGWGSYATVWLARDLKLSRNVALKILIADPSHGNREVQILQQLSSGAASHRGKKYVVQLLDYFEHKGPNGTHQCLVLEPLGPSVVSEAELYPSNRLPGKIARELSRQTAGAVAYIHANGIAHGDLHPGNLVFATTLRSDQSDIDLVSSMGQPQRGDVLASPNYPLTAHLPQYLVLPRSLPFVARDSKTCQVRLIDFGEAFQRGQQPPIHCPLVFRAPEAVFGTQRGLEADIWSLGCTIFELVVGYPPFDNIMPNKDDLIQEWISMFGDLPEEWKERLPSPSATDNLPSERMSVRDWLHETYFDADKKANFSTSDIDSLGALLQSMMQYRPADRPTAADVLEHPWFQSKRELSWTAEGHVCLSDCPITKPIS